VILAGGFVRHPALWAVRAAEAVTRGISLSLVIGILFGYAKVARFRYRRAPEVAASINEFISRRTELDRQAAAHRLHLLAHNDPRPDVRELTVPVCALTGFWDPVVPWPWVQRWLRKNCPSLRAYRIIARADHNVLGTAPEAAAQQVVEWIDAYSQSL
jgi:pimeloyl-ACP methyl ester carboxylesterase